jgi:tetratricopeptide (TPR) repeat protein
MGKVPADRFENVGALRAALDRVDLSDLRPAHRGYRSRHVVIVAGVAIVALTAYLVTRPDLPLDAGRVVVFPFSDIEPGHERESEQANVLLASSLERIEPTRWLNGRSLLRAADLASRAGLSPERARAIAQDQGARYYLSGSIIHERDSLRVLVTLHDVAEGRDTSLSISGGGRTSAADLGVTAAVSLLPRMTGLDKVIDPAGLRGRDPGAVTNWVRGEREYRESRIRQAFEYLHRAVAGDERLAQAALRGATAAMWLNREDTALALVATALRHPESLVPRQAAFGDALRLVLTGQADSAIIALRAVLALDEQWPDAWMLAGETFMHLFPRIALNPRALTVVPAPTEWPLETWADDAFKRALALDPGFTPPLAHLAEIAARRGETGQFTRYAGPLERAGADSGTLASMSLTRACLTRTPARVDWAAEAKRSLLVLYRVGVRYHTASSPVARNCARRAFGAILAADSSANVEDWGTLMALYGMLVAQGEPEAALRLVDSAVTGGMKPALGLYLVGSAAGIDAGSRADEFIGQLEAAIQTRSAQSLWLLALWSARRDDSTRLLRVVQALETRASRPTGNRLDTLMIGVASAYLALARRDTAAAMERFAGLHPTGTIEELQRTLWEPLAPERLTYARLLLATGDPAAAHRIASVLDQPGIAVFPLFLRQSLVLRQQAAAALRDERLISLASERLRSLAEVPQ